MKSGLVLCMVVALGMASGAKGNNWPRVVDVTDCAGLIGENLVAGDASEGLANTRRVSALMAGLQSGATVRFPAGDYYFSGTVQPGHGTIETSAPGQVIMGDGVGATRIIQMDARRDFGFVGDEKYKRVSAATVRLQNKGCVLQDLSVVVDPAIPALTMIESAAIQVAHLAYLPSGQPMIVETTGIGADWLIDHVIVSRVNVGENLARGIKAERFFELGVDIVGSGGHVRVREMDRMDARIGVRLDNGNHCGQGEYTFEDLHIMGRSEVTGGGVFFDWVGGQAPVVRHCSASFVNGFHAGPLGLDGDRLEPYPEGEVNRSVSRDWDWLTWHEHSMPAEPTEAERKNWYGLPRMAKVVQISSVPRTGGVMWKEGVDFEQEKIAGDGGLAGTTKIHWIGENRPASGATYFVTFEQPKEYRVHDLEWGLLDDFSSQEARQQEEGIEAFAIYFEDQGFGSLNPDFDFPVGFGFTVSKNFILNGDVILRGRVQYMQWSDNTVGVCTTRLEGLGPDRQIRDLRFSQSKQNDFVLGDYVQSITIEDNIIWGGITLEAPLHADRITIKGNEFRGFSGAAVRLEGAGLNSVRVLDNIISGRQGDGIMVRGATRSVVSGNVVSGLKDGTAITLEDVDMMILKGNMVTGNAAGIGVKGGQDSVGTVTANVSANNKKGDWVCRGARELEVAGNSWE